MEVHIWLPHGQHVGHTSLTVRGIYFSFWPEDSAGKKDLKTKRSHSGSLMQTLDDDVFAEDGQLPLTVELVDLDEDAVLTYVKGVQANLPRYQIARNNCSHVVAAALIAGAGRKPSFIPHAGSYARLGRIVGVGIWTPDQVLRFVEELKRG
ncbi:MAG: hypothetical protein ACTHL8_02775 [Burkholderiaceae bacterium]